MERSYEEHYHRAETHHWWFCARRERVLQWVRQLAPDPRDRILDIGCSSGLLLRALKERGYGEAEGIDSSAEGVVLCRRAGLRAQVMDAHQPEYAEGSFAGLVASDVLEHLEHDAVALKAWQRVLQPGGWLMVFVPAFPWLWTRHDTVNRHFRRYTRSQLVRLLVEAGFVVERSSYWNTALFFPVALLRLWRRWRGQGEESATGDDAASDMFLPPAPVNWMLHRWLSLENCGHSAGLNSPVGISVMILARKPVAEGNSA